MYIHYAQHNKLSYIYLMNENENNICKKNMILIHQYIKL